MAHRRRQPQEVTSAALQPVATQIIYEASLGVNDEILHSRALPAIQLVRRG